MNPRYFLSLALVCVSLKAQSAQTAGQYTPAGKISISAADRTELERGVEKLGTEIEKLRVELKDRAALAELLPDVQIYHKAVQWPLLYDEFFRSNEVTLARALLKQGMERARALHEGKTPWTSGTGLVVRGYISKIDGSIQPYGLVVPPTFRAGAAHRHRLDVWLHGRDNNLTELKFISDRQKSFGEFTPADTFVLHPYGRFCNAFKFAGEVDVFEAVEHAARHYGVNERRVGLRGFSMGGAGAWHLGAHHPSVWAAVAPGAGFAETAEYTGTLKKDPKPAWYEQKLWHLYDATDYAANFANAPVIAYSGELDKQKQAADMMVRAMKAEGLELTHLIGPGVEHKYEPATKKELARQFDGLMAKDREAFPAKIRFTTYSLRYSQAAGGIQLLGLEKHWERAHLEADVAADGLLKVKTKNISAFSVPGKFMKIEADGEPLIPPAAGASAKVLLFKQGGKWKVATPAEWLALNQTSSKRPGRQGPIDDAFMDSFIMVRPTGQPLNEKSGAWIAAELARATKGWRAQFRGDARVKDDIDVTEKDIAESNLVLWGDPSSNRLLAKIADKLPIHWDAQNVRVGTKTFSATQHVPVLIYPNPLNQKRYVVVNSGFTFSAFGHASNAQQTPKLPDYAVLDMDVPVSARGTSGVVEAGFFGERWELVEAGPK